MTQADQTEAYFQGFGQAVRQHRERLKISQEELSHKAELDRTYVSGVERGVRNPTLKSILRLAAALEVPPSTLLKTAERCAASSD